MKLLIEHGEVKREIVGSFNICGSWQDLELLATQIRHKIESNPDWCYGWIEIHGEIQKSLNGPPIHWNSKGG